MDIKDIFLILSENEEKVSYTSILFETTAEKITFIAFLVFFILYIVLIAFKFEFIALVSAFLSIASLLIHSVTSFIKTKQFLNYPIRSYVESLNKSLDSEKELIQTLIEFPVETLVEATNTAEFEMVRIKSNITFISGSIEKVGIFPSLLALFYAFHEYQASSSSSLLAYIILGAILGVYMGVILLKRMSSWQNGCIHLLNQAIKMKGGDLRSSG